MARTNGNPKLHDNSPSTARPVASRITAFYESMHQMIDNNAVIVVGKDLEDGIAVEISVVRNQRGEHKFAIGIFANNRNIANIYDLADITSVRNAIPGISNYVWEAQRS
jgi:hypothetical protein